MIASNGKTACGTLKAVERACVTTDGGTTVCGKYKSVKGEQEQEQRQEEARNPTPSAGYRKESDGITYVLRSCRRSGSDIKCNFVITQKKENNGINIHTGKGNSSIVDSAGRAYPSSNAEYNGANQNTLTLSMSPGVDYVFDINFENIPGQIRQAALVNLTVFSQVIQFRNIPFSN